MHLKNQEQMSHRKVYIETYGCQMNVNDTEVIFSILAKAGYERTENMEEADVLYGVTMQEKGVSKLLELKTAEMAQKLGLA